MYDCSSMKLSSPSPSSSSSTVSAAREFLLILPISLCRYLLWSDLNFTTAEEVPVVPVVCTRSGCCCCWDSATSQSRGMKSGLFPLPLVGKFPHEFPPVLLTPIVLVLLQQAPHNGVGVGDVLHVLQLLLLLRGKRHRHLGHY